MKKKVVHLSLFASSLMLAAGCSHSSPRYQPEVGDAQSIASKGGVVYPIPAANAQLRMKLVSLPEPKKHTLHVRMYFKRVQTDEKATLDPMSQVLLLPDHGGEIRPSRIYASSKKKPLIDLSGRDKQAIELVYQLPSGGDQYPYFQFHWTVAYGSGQTETQVVRFDREITKYPESVAQKQDLEGDFPYADALGLFGPAWIGNDFGWWDGGVF